MDVVCVGDCGIDHYLPDGQRRVGGITTNFALWARRSFPPDDRIRIVAPLGNDADAELVRARFADEAIDCDFAILEGSTPVQFIEVDGNGERHFPRYEEGVLRSFRVRRRQLADADLVVAPVFEQNRRMFGSVLDALPDGCGLAVDFADFAGQPDRDLVDGCAGRLDVAFFGLSVDDADTIEFLRTVADAHDVVIVVTLGADGSIAFSRDGFSSRGAEVTDRVVDTTGAGDAFAAGFLSRYLRTRDVGQALADGALLATNCIRRFGGN